ncbi:PTS fructose transporter subunit IIABC [Lactiplantibacillus daowaiensis]|uniref:Fructose-specific PTS transporter subunit EIIC n=1 Tax=Lactiplantibacillus daowaiensis TaxID=2559918 RepID=A0ABW1S0H3_9LACO|nr:PTS fructose transporter subunit IIABC [Lactiplantibacillus daowaiensis]
MKISELLTTDTIDLNLTGTEKKDVISALAKHLYDAGKVDDLAAFTADVWARENEISTAVGNGIAIPHAKSKHVKNAAIAFGRALPGIEYGDDECQLFFLIAAGENASNEHLKALSKLSGFLMDDVFRANLILARTPDDVEQLIADKEQADAADAAKPAVAPSAASQSIVGVTACTAGIAHTYMSAQALTDAGEKLNIPVKIETEGSSGTENELTAEEIKNATAVVIAVDRTIDLSRFDGKHVLQTSTKAGINDAENLVKSAVDAPIYHSEGGSQPTATASAAKGTSAKSIGFGIYKHLMNGVSFMLPFVVAGGILMAISFMFGTQSANTASSQYNAFAAFLNMVGSKAAFGLMVPIFAGYVAYSIADRPGLAPGAIGGMIAYTGGSGFLGGVVAGFVAGYVVVGLKKIFGKMPSSLQGLNPVLFYPVLGTFFTSFIINYLINTPVSSFNKSLTAWLQHMTGANAVLVGFILAALLVSDMGGPLNKITYAFGIQMLTAGVYEPMAAIMCGGMIPPIALGLATTFFKNKFSAQERETGKVAYILGACFITEGVIPFAGSDPLRVIPGNIIGAGVGGALSMLMGITLQAPHGGIFVIPIAINKPLLYLVCILAGAAVECLIVGLTKKAVSQEPAKKAKDDAKEVVSIF